MVWKGINRGIRPDRQFLFSLQAINAIRAVILFRGLYFVTSDVTIGWYNWTLDWTTDIWIMLCMDFTLLSDHYTTGLSNRLEFRHHWIILQKICFTNGHPGLYIHIYLDSDIFGLYDIFPRSWLEIHHNWTLVGDTGYKQINIGH